MSGEGRDSTYNPRKKTEKRPVMKSRIIRKKNQVDYSEVEIVTSDSDSEGTIANSESGIGNINLESGLTELELENDRSVDIWTPGTLRNTANQAQNNFLD